MSLIIWNESYSVGVPEIDKQHKKLVELANRTHDAMLSGNIGQELKQVVAELITYTVEHFASEEELMTRYRYPRAAEHKRRHAAMAVHVTELQQQIEAGKASGPLQLKSFLRDWLMKHIQETDRQFGAYVQARRAA